MIQIESPFLGNVLFLVEACMILTLTACFLRIFYVDLNKQQIRKIIKFLRTNFTKQSYYPDSKPFEQKNISTETAFDIILPEPYKRLERYSEKRNEWLQEQKEHFTKYMGKLSYSRSQLKSRLRKFQKYEAFETPFLVNNNRYFYFKKYRRDQEHYILFTTSNVHHKGNVLFDPNIEFYQQNIKILGTWVSHDALHLCYAYIINIGKFGEVGERNLIIKVRNVLTGRENIDDCVIIPLSDEEMIDSTFGSSPSSSSSTFSFSLSWLHNSEGFFYTRIGENIPQECSTEGAYYMEQMQQVLFHKLSSSSSSSYSSSSKYVIEETKKEYQNQNIIEEGSDSSSSSGSGSNSGRYSERKHSSNNREKGNNNCGDFVVYSCPPEKDENGRTFTSACPVITVTNDDNYLCINLYEENDLYYHSSYSQRGNKLIIIDISQFNFINCADLGPRIPVINNYSDRFVNIIV